MNTRCPSWIPALALALQCFSISAEAQSEVGNGGDPIQLVFGKARIDARTVITSYLRAQGRPGNTAHFSLDVRSFLDRPSGSRTLAHDLLDDLMASKHVFFDPSREPIVQTTCARTNLGGAEANAIRFSLPLCRSLINEQGEELAIILLIHEATHHFGVAGSPEEEDFASRTGRELFDFWQLERDRNKPYWEPLPFQGSPPERYDHASALLTTGNQPQSAMFVWGGCNRSLLPDRESCSHFLNSGATLTWGSQGPAWQTTSPSPLSGRRLPGSTFVPSDIPNAGVVALWGGCRGSDAACSDFPQDGAFYRPASNDWIPFSAPPQVPGRIQHTLASSSAGLFVFGGRTANRVVLGDAHLVTAGGWQELNAPEAIAGRYGHSSTPFEDGVIVFGGCARLGLVACSEYLRDGFVWTPSGWEMLPPAPEQLAGRAFHGAAVVGRQLVVWGGQNGFGSALSDGAIFDFDNQRWTLIPGALLPRGESGRHSLQISESGGTLLVFGGQAADGTLFQSIVQLQWNKDAPDQQSWRLVETDTSPIGRKGHTQLMLPQGLVIWAGYGANQTYLPTGALLKMGEHK